MPYKDIKLTLLGGRKCLINPGSIKGMLEFPDETVITLVKGLNFYPYQIIVLEKIDEIKKKFKSISEKQYWKDHPIKGLKPDCVIFDELKIDK